MPSLDYLKKNMTHVVKRNGELSSTIGNSTKKLKTKYPIPILNTFLDKLGRYQYFATLDLASGFHQIEMHIEDIQKAAFSTENGRCELLRMPFGLKDAPTTFQCVMDSILGIWSMKFV